MIHVTCPQCASSLTASDDKAGKAGRCPSCRKTIQMPKKVRAIPLKVWPVGALALFVLAVMVSAAVESVQRRAREQNERDFELQAREQAEQEPQSRSEQRRREAAAREELGAAEASRIGAQIEAEAEKARMRLEDLEFKFQQAMRYGRGDEAVALGKEIAEMPTVGDPKAQRRAYEAAEAQKRAQHELDLINAELAELRRR